MKLPWWNESLGGDCCTSSEMFSGDATRERRPDRSSDESAPPKVGFNGPRPDEYRIGRSY